MNELANGEGSKDNPVWSMLIHIVNNKKWGDYMWKDVIGFEGFYMVNELGEIKSKPRCGTKGGILKQVTKKDGYKTVSLCKNGKYSTYSVHRIVYFSFYPNANQELQINHKD